MAVSVIRTAWAGTSGGPGLTQLFITEASGFFLTPTSAQTAVDAVRTFWNAIAATLPNELVLTVSPVIDSYNQLNGDLIGSTSAATPPASVAGTDTGAYSMPSGMKVNLNTGVIRFGRRVRGSIFIVPAANAVLTTNGAVASASRTTVNNAASTMRTTLNTAGLPLVVFSRPKLATATQAARDGAFSLVSALETNEKVAVLRGRRD